MSRVAPVLIAVLVALSIPIDGAADSAKKYDCAKLITAAQVQAATGLPSAKFLIERYGTAQGEPAESTSCQFTANQGAISIGVTVATGGAVALYEAAVFSGPAGGRETLPSIGDAAVYLPQGHTAGARAHGDIVLVKFQANHTGALDGIGVKDAATKILKRVVGRL